ncbi:MAG: asparagine synthase (glutamine-hydrolyzing) [Pseudomonadota bacterium]|nr:asparagine synthase (glutamine-hydrolyzing) [Pseudomonadota bacterium]
MCGIAGYLQLSGFSAEAGEAIARMMAKAIHHRGPDDSGIWLDAEAGVAFGHRRLSIVDLSPAGHQPMTSASGRWVIAFNGEIYNHADLRQALQASAAAPAWRGHSDTETLLAGFEAWGIENTLQRCVGMFALALWDRTERQLHLMRDRLGEKPLYYGWAGDALVFGSELKALRAHPSWRGEVDRDVLTLFFRHNYIPAPYSIYKGVWKLSPGTWRTVSQDDVRRRQLPAPNVYWSVLAAAARAREEPFSHGDAAALVELERISGKAIALQRISDVPVGAFLSGGVDSSAIVALMQAQSSRRVRTFTIGFAEAGYNEAGYAKAVARHLGTDHTELYVSPKEAQAVIPRLPAIYDEPFSDSSQIPTFLVAQHARQHVTVSLSGDAGDELFGGYNRYFLARDLRRKLMCMPRSMRRRLAQAVGACPPWLLDALLRPLGAVVPYFRVSQPSDKAYNAAEVLALADDGALYRRLVSHWKDPSSLVLGAREPATLLDELLMRSGVASTFEQWMMTTDTLTYLPDNILVKVDRAAMAVSLETRAPFLDHRLVEFVLSLPLPMKIRDGQGKWLLRQMLYKYVPKTLIERPKMGFGVPIDSWLRGPLRDWAEGQLDDARLRREGFLDPAPIRRKWEEHQSGARNWQYYLWDVLMFQAWLEAEHA